MEFLLFEVFKVAFIAPREKNLKHGGTEKTEKRQPASGYLHVERKRYILRLESLRDSHQCAYKASGSATFTMRFIG